MKVINVGNEFNIYDNLVQTFDNLPAGIYYLRFVPMKGFFFEKKSDFDISEEKIYGGHLEKIEKVFHAYDSMERNLGVIASGDKGIGKSLFAKLLCNRAIKEEYPVIIVDQAYKGIPDIIDKIDQKCVVLFDEFEKVFIDSDPDSECITQNSLLSMFDGINNGKKLFIITCNKLDDVSEYVVNRPGRFHYHFRFSYPTPDEVETYLKDNIEKKFYNQIESVKKFSMLTNINYDCLRSIAFELNLGSSFEEAIKDLNIINYMGGSRYDIVLFMTDGTKLMNNNIWLKILSGSKRESIDIYTESEKYAGNVKFNVNDIIYDKASDAYIIDSNNIEFDPDSYDEKITNSLKKKTPKKLIIKQSRINYDFCF